MCIYLWIYQYLHFIYSLYPIYSLPISFYRDLHHISPLKCMYVGDAAGRLKTSTRNADFAATDYKYALNLGIQVR